MKEEIAAAVFFVARLVKRYGVVDNDGRERFAAALTAVLFESYRKHWHAAAPARGQAYRCLRVNRVRVQDPVLQQACVRSSVRYQDLGLPEELTVWVDPGEVSCRYGEHSSPFCVWVVDAGRRRDGEFSRRVQEAVERASLDVQSGSSDEEEVGGALIPVQTSTESKTIPTVINPNSVYRFSEFAPGAPPAVAVGEEEERVVPSSSSPGGSGPPSLLQPEGFVPRLLHLQRPALRQVPLGQQVPVVQDLDPRTWT